MFPGQYINLQGVPEYDDRDIDAFVEGLGTVEVKTDRHRDSGNFFFEVEVGGKPGCIFASRADWLLYWFPPDEVYLIPLPELQYWLAANWRKYAEQRRERDVYSRRGQRKWRAVGIIPRRTTILHEVPGARKIMLKEPIHV